MVRVSDSGGACTWVQGIVLRRGRTMYKDAQLSRSEKVSYSTVENERYKYIIRGKYD